MIELTPLKYFISAYETGTFSQAARLNHVSQPTVSIAIQKLEAHLGGPLFQRAKSGLTPTSMATQLYHDTIDSVAHLSSLENRLSGKPQQTLRMHCAPDVLLRPFRAALKSLRWGGSDMQLSFTDTLLNSEVAFVTASCAPSDHNFIPLLTEGFGIALERHHPLAAHDTLSLEDIQNEPVIERPYCPTADRLDIVWPNRPQSSANAVHDLQLLELIAAGFGVAFVPLSHKGTQKDVVVRALTGVEMQTRTVGISHRRSAFASDLAGKLSAANA